MGHSVIALFFSWAGDVTLVWFVIGLACFLIALGGAFFVASDSILAVNLLLDPGIPMAQFGASAGKQKTPGITGGFVVGDTGLEPMTSSV